MLTPVLGPEKGGLVTLNDSLRHDQLQRFFCDGRRSQSAGGLYILVHMIHDKSARAVCSEKGVLKIQVVF